MNIPPTTATALTGLDPRAFSHPLDRSATQALSKLKGFDRAAAKFLEWNGERRAYVELNATAIRVTSKQFTHLHSLLVHGCDVLDMPVPELFVQRGELNAFTSGHNNPYVVVTTSLVDSMSDDELLAVIAHELGHIKCSHVLYKTMINVLTDVGARSALSSRKVVLVLLTSLAMPHVQRALATWNQRSELSADRASMLVVQNEEACLRMMLKLAGAPIRMVDQMSTGEFLEQAAHLADLTSDSGIANRHRQSMLALSSHPLTVERARQLHVWIRDGDYQRALSDPTAEAMRPVKPVEAPRPTRRVLARRH